MPDVDLNQKVWGVKAQTHFYGFSMIYVMISFINLVTIIDLMALPPKVKDEYGFSAYTYLWNIPVTMVCACLLLLILSCIRIKYFYGIVAVILIGHSIFSMFGIFLNLLMPKPLISLPSLFQAEADKVKKYYKYSMIGATIDAIFTSVVKTYLGIVLLKLSFCAPRPVIYVDHHRRRSRSDLEQRSGGDEEEEVEEDIEEKSRSKKKEVDKNEKSGNSKSGTGKTEKSLKKSKSGTGKSEKSGKTGNSGN